jgi:hypothetical protein
VPAASGGSHVTIFEAEVTLVPGNSVVQVFGVHQNGALSHDLEAARDAIRRGAETALSPLRLGAVIQVERIVIHPVDFKAREFDKHTAKELRRLLQQN